MQGGAISASARMSTEPAPVPHMGAGFGHTHAQSTRCKLLESRGFSEETTVSVECVRERAQRGRGVWCVVGFPSDGVEYAFARAYVDLEVK